MQVSVRMLAHLSSQISNGNTTWALLTLNEYKGTSPGLRRALFQRARATKKLAPALIEKLEAGCTKEELSAAEIENSQENMDKSCHKMIPTAETNYRLLNRRSSRTPISRSSRQRRAVVGLF